MTILCWNCRRLKNLETVWELFCKVKEKCPNIFFLMETKLRSNKWTQLNKDKVQDYVSSRLCWKKQRSCYALEGWSGDWNSKLQPLSRKSGCYPQLIWHLDIHRILRSSRISQTMWSMRSFAIYEINGTRPLDVCRQLQWNPSPVQKNLGEGDDPITSWKISKISWIFVAFMNLIVGGPVFTWNNGRECDDFTMERSDRVVANHT